MAKTTNREIRQAMRGRNVKQWQVAKALGTREDTFSRKLREELPEDEKQKILAVIEAMGEGK